MQIMLLGGHGFVGRNVLEVLGATEHKVIPYSRRNGVDLTDLASITEAIKNVRPDVIVNCAAIVGSLNYVTQQAADVIDQNTRMITNLYRATAKTTPKAVLINPIANCAYAGHLTSYREDAFWDGPVHNSVLSYGSAKRLLITLSECYFMQFGMRSINFHTPNMYGPYDSTDPNKAHALNALASKIVKAKREGSQQLEVWGSGAAVREWLFAPDFARVILKTLKVMDNQDFSTPRNIAQNDGWSVKMIVDRLVAEARFKGEIVWDRSRPDGAPRKVMDDALFRKTFPEFGFTDLGEGIRKTIDYYESIYPY